MIKRPTYLEKLIAWKDKRTIKILTGVRRCGKSTLFKLYQEYLLANGVSGTQIISINFEDPNFSDLSDWKKLYDYIVSKILPNKINYVFLDEIQNVPDFQKAADGLFIKDNIDLYLTGSNSRFQSGQWATMLAGRFIQINVLPLSFKEFVSAYPFADSREIMFRRYLENSSFPYTLELRNESVWNTSMVRDYLSGIYSTIVLKDVVENKRIKDIDRLESVIKFIADNIGSRVSSNSIANTMTSNGTKIDYATIESYLQAFCDSYILYKADRYDVKGKKVLKTLNKYYLVDLGLRYFLLGDRQIDTGRMLENVVFLELFRRNRKVYIGKIDTNKKSANEDSREIDFIAESDKNTVYYQVAQSVLDPKTLERELAPLESLKNHNPKYLLTLDQTPRCSHNGILQLNAIDWLLGEE